MKTREWEKGWLDKTLDQADKAVKNWPKWMQALELRYPLYNNKKEETECLIEKERKKRS